MNIDAILETFNRQQVNYILIGGVNFLLRHEPVLTFDIDLWVEDSGENLERCEKALGLLDAEWGAAEDAWLAVRGRKSGWMASQAVFCLTSPHGAIDVFRTVRGLESWSECRCRAVEGRTLSGVAYVGLNDRDMLACQQALPEHEQRQDRIRILRNYLEEGDRANG